MKRLLLVFMMVAFTGTAFAGVAEKKEYRKIIDGLKAQTAKVKDVEQGLTCDYRVHIRRDAMHETRVRLET